MRLTYCSAAEQLAVLLLRRFDVPVQLYITRCMYSIVLRFLLRADRRFALDSRDSNLACTPLSGPGYRTCVSLFVTAIASYVVLLNS